MNEFPVSGAICTLIPTCCHGNKDEAQYRNEITITYFPPPAVPSPDSVQVVPTAVPTQYSNVCDTVRPT